MTDGNRPVQPSEARKMPTGHREAASEERAQSNPPAGCCGGSGFKPRSYPIVLVLYRSV